MEEFEHLDYYTLLGVSPDASASEIKRAYRQQVSRYHPDHYTHATPEEQLYASQRMQRINESYRVLSDVHERAAYDREQRLAARWRRSSVRPPASAAGSPLPHQAPPSPPPPARDHQAELYDQAVEHLNAGRSMQAAATLRELQRINPFYRDSAALLACAEESLGGRQSTTKQRQAATAAPGPAATPREAPRQNEKRRLRPVLAFLSGLGAVLVVGLGVLSIFSFALPPISTGGIKGEENTPAGGASPLPAAAVGREPATATSSPASFLEGEARATPTRSPGADAVEEETPAPSPTLVAAAPIASAILIASATPPPAMPLTPSPTPTPCPTPAAAVEVAAEEGEVLQTYSFRDAEGWATVQGSTWSVGAQQGAYYISAQPGSGNIWSYRTSPGGTRYSVGVDMQVNAGSGGLVLHFVDGSSYVAFLVAPSEGRFWLEQQSSGQKEIVAEQTSPAIQGGANATNRLVAHLEGTSLKLFINSALVFDQALDRVSPTARYGLVAAAESTAATARFDNLEIRTLK